MAAEAPIFTLPETVTISGEVALALLDAFARVGSDLLDEGTDGIDNFYGLEKAANDGLEKALGYDGDTPPWYDAMSNRSAEIAKDIRRMMRGNDTLRLAALERAVLELGTGVIGVFWDEEKLTWREPTRRLAPDPLRTAMANAASEDGRS